MSYIYKLLPDEPILTLTLDSSFDLERDSAANNQELASILDSVEQPVYYITDVRAVETTIFQNFVMASSMDFHRKGILRRHPKINATIIVSNQNIARLAAMSLDSETFRHLSTPVFNTMAEALAYTRALIAQQHHLK